MSFLQELENFKQELRQAWIKYYSENKEVLKTLGISEGEKWKSEKYQESYTLPRAEVILSVLLAVRPDLRQEIEFFGKTIGKGQYNKIIKDLGLTFHIEKELEKQFDSSQESLNELSMLDDIREQIKQQNGGEF